MGAQTRTFPPNHHCQTGPQSMQVVELDQLQGRDDDAAEIAIQNYNQHILWWHPRRLQEQHQLTCSQSGKMPKLKQVEGYVRPNWYLRSHRHLCYLQILNDHFGKISYKDSQHNELIVQPCRGSQCWQSHSQNRVS